MKLQKLECARHLSTVDRARCVRMDAKGEQGASLHCYDWISKNQATIGWGREKGSRHRHEFPYCVSGKTGSINR